MSNSPNITRDIFNASKRFLGGKLQGNEAVMIHDWDWNENQDEVVWFLLQTAFNLCGSGGRIQTASGKSFQPTEIGTPAANILFTDGAAIVGGRLVLVESGGGTFEYNDYTTNYIAKGRLSTVVEIVAATTYKITDAEKLWGSDHSLEDCRIRFVDGALAGQTFTITELSGQQIVVSGDLSTADVDDEYVIYPPAVTTTGGTEPLYLVTWFEDISEVEDEVITGGDADITDPTSGLTPSHRRQLRWCIHLDWQGTSGTDVLEDHIAIQIATVNLVANSTVVNADITDESYLYSLDKAVAADVAMDARVDTLEAEMDVEQTITELNLIEDFKPGYLKEMNWSIDGADVGYAPGHEWFNPHAYDDTENPYKSVGWRSGGVYTDFTNATNESSYLKLDNDEGDGQVGTIGETMAQSTSGAIPDEDLAVLAIHANSVSGVIERSFPLGYRPMRQGLDWIVFDDGATHSPVRITPGQIWSGGKWWQNPLEYEVADSRDPAAHMSGSSPTSSWNYLYALPTDTGERSLQFQWSEDQPKWNGEHPSETGWCIGCTYFDASHIPAHGVWRDDRFWVNDDDLLEMYTATPSSALVDADLTIQPPLGAVEVEFQIRAALDVITDMEVKADHQVVANTSVSKRVRLHASTSGTDDRYFYVTLPGTGGTYHTETFTAASGNFKIFLTSFKMKFDFVPDLETWEN